PCPCRSALSKSCSRRPTGKQPSLSGGVSTFYGTEFPGVCKTARDGESCEHKSRTALLHTPASLAAPSVSSSSHQMLRGSPRVRGRPRRNLAGPLRQLGASGWLPTGWPTCTRAVEPSHCPAPALTQATVRHHSLEAISTQDR